jgi:hypothetical protein
MSGQRSYVLSDGNAFYCSCERVFDHRLARQPVIVLSNNDGCALARTTEPRTAITTPVAAPRGIGLRATQGPAGPTVADASFTVLREGDKTPVHEGGAIRLPLKPGRYVVTATTNLRIGTVTVNVTATAPAEIVVPLTGELPRATVTPAQASAQATVTVMVDWTGPNEPDDYLVIAPATQGQDEPTLMA